jgi:WD40 repeat protein
MDHDATPLRLSLWDTTSGRERRELMRAPRRLGCVAFSPDGKLLMAAHNARVLFWDPATGEKAGKPLRRPVRRGARPARGQEGIQTQVMSHDGRRVATAAWGRKVARIRIWDTTRRVPLRSFVVRGGEVTSLAFTADDSRLAVASEHAAEHKQTISLWNVATGRRVLEHHPEEPARHLSPDGRLFAAISHRHRGIVVRDVASARGLPLLPWGGGTLAFSPDGKRLVSQKGSGFAVWDTATGGLRQRFGNPFVTTAFPRYFSFDGRLLVSEESDYGRYLRTRIWDVATGRYLGPRAAHLANVTCLAFAHDGKMIATGSTDQTVRLWDAGTGRQRRLLDGLKSGVAALAFSPDRKTLAGALTEGSLCLWEASSGRPRGRVANAGDLVWLSYSRDGKLLRGGTRDGALVLWDLDVAKRPHRLTPPWDGLARMVLAPDGKTLVTQGRSPLRSDGKAQPPDTIRLWDSALRNERVLLKPGSGDPPLWQCSGLALSPDGKVLVTAEYRHEGGSQHDLAIRLWETATGRPILRLPLRWYGNLLVFSPDGRLLASAHIDYKRYVPRIILWDTASGKELACFSGHTSWVNALVFAPDCKTLASASRDSTALLWDVATLRRDQAPAAPLTVKELQAHWDNLAGDDAARAWQSIHRVIAAPEQAVPFLRKHLHPALPLDGEQVRRWIADLGNVRFTIRNRATIALEALGEQPEGLLREALRASPSLEHRRRIETLLTRIERFAPPPERLRGLRTLTVLERIGTAEARQLLRALAAGAPNARLTEEARQALARLSTKGQ